MFFIYIVVLYPYAYYITVLLKNTIGSTLVKIFLSTEFLWMKKSLKFSFLQQRQIHANDFFKCTCRCSHMLAKIIYHLMNRFYTAGGKKN